MCTNAQIKIFIIEEIRSRGKRYDIRSLIFTFVLELISLSNQIIVPFSIFANENQNPESRSVNANQMTVN